MSQYAPDSFSCTGDGTPLCGYITDSALCNAYTAASEALGYANCQWNEIDGVCENNPPTTCEMYYEINNACPPPCDLNVVDTGTFGGRLRFRIYKDLPTPNSYGQYYHSNNYDSFTTDTGIITETDVDDLYSTMDMSIEPFSNSNLESQLQWTSGENEIRIELHSIMWDSPMRGSGPYYLDEYDKQMWVEVVDSTTYDGMYDFFSTAAFVVNKSPFARRGPWSGESNSCFQGEYTCPGQDGGYTNQLGHGPWGGNNHTYGKIGGSYAALDGWVLWDGNGDDSPNNIWAYRNTASDQGPTEFNNGSDENIAVLNDSNIENMITIDGNSSEWVEFLRNPDMKLIIIQYLDIKGTSSLSGGDDVEGAWFGISEISSAEIRSIIRSGVDGTIDTVMTKRFCDTGLDSSSSYIRSDNSTYECGNYSVSSTDGSGRFAPYYMEGTWFTENKSTAFTRVRIYAPDVSDLTEEADNYNFFFNLGGKRLQDLPLETYTIDADPIYSGYNIEYPPTFFNFDEYGVSNLYGKQILPDDMYTTWRPIPHVFIGETDNYEEGIYIQKYYDFLEPERPYASAPNIVNLNMFIAENDGLNNISYVSYYDKVFEKYVERAELLTDANAANIPLPMSALNHNLDNTYNTYQYADYGQPVRSSSRDTPECCSNGPGYCTSWCQGGVRLSHSCSCTSGASPSEPVQEPCYGDHQIPCVCEVDCSNYDIDSSQWVYGCMDTNATNYNPEATLDCPECCFYGSTPNVNFVQKINQHFEYEFKSETDCSLGYESGGCLYSDDITFELTAYWNWEDYIDDFLGDYGYLYESWPTGDPVFEIYIDLGNGTQPLYLDLNNGDGLTNQLRLNDGDEIQFTITPEQDVHYQNFMFEGTDNEYFNNNNPGGINWRYEKDEYGRNYFPRVSITHTYNRLYNYDLRPEWLDTQFTWQPYVQQKLDNYNDVDYIIWYPGCTDIFGDQYNSNAYIPEGETTADYCTYNYSGCTDTEAINYSPTAEIDDGSCVYPGEYGFDINPVEASVISDQVYEFINTSIDNTNTIDYMQKLKMFVVNWNFDSSKDDDFDTLVFPTSESDIELEQQLNNTYIPMDVFDTSEVMKPNFLSHQYNEPGVKVIKAIVLSVIENDAGIEMPISIKPVTIKINLTLDDVYIEDFAETSGPDFKFLPFSDTTPVISGISSDSTYIKSLDKILNGGQFSEDDVIDRVNLEKALENREIGDYVGSTAIEQVRYFKDGSFDIPKLLGIESSYENFVNPKKDNDFYKYNEFWYWNGSVAKYPEESSVGSIFIDDAVHPPHVTRKCLLELNMGESDGRVVIDTSGNGNKGILIGDYKLSKQSKDTPIRRETEMKLPRIVNDDDKAL
tara:strand:+ start:13559 stop:17620 length:4062 start_codon:yes stop_codon:yes gene_type:complete